MHSSCRLGPDGQEYAICSSSLSSSLWVSREGRARRLYHDTQMWSSLLPPRLRNGCSLCLSNGVSLEGEVERVWTKKEEALLLDEDDDDTRVAIASAPARRARGGLPLLVLSRAREHASLPSLAASFGRTERWTLACLCRGICASPHAFPLPRLLSRFVPPPVWRAVWSLSPREVEGSLSPLVQRVRGMLSASGEEEAGEADLLFDRVRLSRLARRAEEGMAAPASPISTLLPPSPFLPASPARA